MKDRKKLPVGEKLNQLTVNASFFVKGAFRIRTNVLFTTSEEMKRKFFKERLKHVRQETLC